MLEKLFTAALFVFATLAFLAAPDRPVAASECSALGSILCEEVVECTGFWLWKKCKTTDRSYWMGF